MVLLGSQLHPERLQNRNEHKPDQEAGLGLAAFRLCDLEPAPKRRRLEERSLQPFSTALLCCVLRAERGSSFLIALGEVEPEGPRDRPQDSERQLLLPALDCAMKSLS